jgi:ATP-dependent helicase/nuclease subunit A
VVPYIPAFKRETEAVSGTVRGNAYHRVMELLDFEELLSPLFAEFPKDYESYLELVAKNQPKSKVGDGQSLQSRLQHFLLGEKESLRLNAEYFDAVKLEKILHFLESELAYRMWAAQRRDELYREQPFVLGIDARRLGRDFPEEEKVLIQGIIDVFFVEDGQLVLLDYKTDVIGSLEELWNRYAVQLEYYEEALSRLMELPVKEKILYSFYLECY